MKIPDAKGSSGKKLENEENEGMAADKSQKQKSDVSAEARK